MKSYKIVEEGKQDNFVFLHISFSGGDGMIPLGILNNGQDSIDVDITLRKDINPESDIIPVSGTWRIVIRNQDGQVYDIIRVTLTDGISKISYTTTNPPAICKVEEKDFEKLRIDNNEFSIKIIGNPIFKVYRDVTLTPARQVEKTKKQKEEGKLRKFFTKIFRRKK